ncbi:MAG: autotransporter, partial [candidate division NC10 bacterium]|nr:autotransporter [candidate division NC10 bacterium]
KSGQVDLLEGKADPESKLPPPSLAKKPVPAIHIATAPTELIVTEGKPNFVSISGTALTYAENTTGHLFNDTRENKLYMLVSGRWFRAASTAGPWEFVPGGKLPEDFSKIPDDSPKENVKASVPGTQQALEAVIAAHIPQTATVSRTEVKINPPQFDGEPQFKPLEGTPLQYVVNTATPIIRIDAKTFYAVENGIWFKAESAQGPWAVADSVPAVIYTIPPSAPLHYVTYVKVYGSTETTVDVGYTPGYYGAVVTQGSGYVVVYGTGYYYTPWVATTWFGPPVTYGCGSSITYTPWSGWAVSFGFGWSWGYPMYPMGWGWGPYPWWGPVGWGYYYPYPYYVPVYGGVAWGPGGAVAWGPGGWAATTGNVYHRYGDTGAVTRTSQGFNAWTGNQWASQLGMSYNSRNGNIAAGQRGAVHNVYTGNYAYGGRGAVTSGTTGNTYTAGRIAVGNSETGQSGSAGYIRGESGGVARVGDSVIAAKDGTVYRKGEGGWEQNSGGGWNSVNAPSSSSAGQSRAEAMQNAASQRGMQQDKPARDSQQIQNLNRQWDARSMGQTRTMSNRNFSGGGTRMGRRR